MNFKPPRNLLAITLIALPLVAGAQTKAAAPPAAPAASAAAATPPAPVNVTPEARTAIKELLDAMNTRDSLTKAYAAISQTLAPRMAEVTSRQIEAYPGLSADQKAKVREGMNAPFDAAVKDAQGIVGNPKLIDETYDKMIPIYAAHFTTPEVKQLTVFYKSPVGQKALTTLPQANAETLQAGAASFGPRINAIIEKTVKAQADAVLAQSAPAKK